MVKVVIRTQGIITAHPNMVSVKITESEDFSANESFISVNGLFFKDGKTLSV